MYMAKANSNKTNTGGIFKAILQSYQNIMVISFIKTLAFIQRAFKFNVTFNPTRTL
ncbi:Hypothetical protein I595_637 [Croceitalea dokdonensis DOKDO 023]|uniref:Uncharacterized protein n=1 Tax=Croceitalea dokdonensis DOKDO 023 TaxID=1300341 RepID=A0A0P7B4P1_9FLAO|nr:Hypothetical protein I595_637 [Croceitalea dokdonensis DOKDO 023]